jgi:hypothetical protein
LRAAVEGGSGWAAARLERRAGAGELMVAAASVVATAQGETCVLRVGADGGLEPVAVEVVGDASGSAIVRGGLEIGDRVRVAPLAEERRC